jgi:hypothetical protein
LRTTGLGKRSDVTLVRRWVAVAVVLPVLAAGCSDDPEPRFEPSPSPTESTSSAAAKPKAWEVQSQAGAVAFAKHWIDVFNEAGQSGDTSDLKRLSAPECKACSNFVNMIEDLYATGGRLETRGWAVQAAVPAEGLSVDRPRVSMRVKQAPQKVHDGESGSVESFPGGYATFSARLTWMADSWSMSELVIVE